MAMTAVAAAHAGGKDSRPGGPKMPDPTPSEPSVTPPTPSVPQRSDKARELNEMMPLVINELKEVAARYLRRERPGHTLQATALVDMAWERLVQQRNVDFSDRNQFFAVASNIIRRILVDHAKHKNRDKRGGGWARLSLSAADSVPGEDPIDVLALDDALEKLRKLSERTARVVELRFFGGLTVDQAAGVLGVSARTVADEWVTARAWLYRELRGGGG